MTSEEKREVIRRVAEDIQANRDAALRNVGAWVDRMASEERMDAEAFACCLRTHRLLCILMRHPRGDEGMEAAYQIIQAMFQLGYQTAEKERPLISRAGS